jgi:CrcB protein
VGFLIVFVGGGLGSAGRHGINLLAARLFGADCPIGTLSINIIGSFLMGVVAEYFALKSGMALPFRLFLTTGIIGGFTTFSAFSLETALLYERGEWIPAILYVAATIGVGIGAMFAGLALVRVLNGNP